MIHGSTGNHNKDLVCWKQLEELLESGKAKAIGVSNFGIDGLEYLSMNGEVKPMYVQNKYSVYHSNGQYTGVDELKYTSNNHIAFMSYSTLNTWPQKLAPLKSKIVENIADFHSKTPAQVMLRWALQNGAGVIPRSSNLQRIRENFDLFDFSLSEHEMLALNSLNDLVQSPINRRPSVKSLFSGILQKSSINAPDPFYEFTEQEPKKDPSEISLTIVNEREESISISWVSPKEELHPVDTLAPGAQTEITTYHLHRFQVAMESSGEIFEVIQLDRAKGNRQRIGISSNDDSRMTDEL